MACQGPDVCIIQQEKPSPNIQNNLLQSCFPYFEGPFEYACFEYDRFILAPLTFFFFLFTLLLHDST
jgi:hypothetical protein